MNSEEQIINHLERAKQMIVTFTIQEDGKRDDVFWLPVYQHLLHAIEILEHTGGEK